MSKTLILFSTIDRKKSGGWKTLTISKSWTKLSTKALSLIADLVSKGINNLDLQILQCWVGSCHHDLLLLTVQACRHQVTCSRLVLLRVQPGFEPGLSTPHLCHPVLSGLSWTLGIAQISAGGKPGSLRVQSPGDQQRLGCSSNTHTGTWKGNVPSPLLLQRHPNGLHASFKRHDL